MQNLPKARYENQALKIMRDGIVMVSADGQTSIMAFTEQGIAALRERGYVIVETKDERADDREVK